MMTGQGRFMSETAINLWDKENDAHGRNVMVAFSSIKSSQQLSDVDSRGIASVMHFFSSSCFP
jgi:ABC-type transporter Mla MlaB component